MCKNSKERSEEVYDVVEKTLIRADNLTTDVSFAVVYETVYTITQLYRNKNLLD